MTGLLPCKVTKKNNSASQKPKKIYRAVVIKMTTLGKGGAIKNFATYIDREMIKNIIEAHQNFLFNMIDNSILIELESLKPEYLPNLKCSDESKQFIDSFISSWKDYKETGEGSTVVINFDNNIKQIHRAMVN